MTSKILIVEDDKDIRRHLKRLLEIEEYEVECAENGKVALELLGEMIELPSVIILDLMMPIMDGVHFRKAQLKAERLAAIPVIIMSADTQAEAKATQISADGLLRKPADIELILAMVDRLSRKRA